MTDQEKIIYDILCSDEQPPEGQHWEGFVASKIALALAYPPENAKLPLVRPEEFVKLIQGKENYWGIPMMRTEWPTPEPKAQFEFQNYGWWRDEEGKLQLGTQPQGE